METPPVIPDLSLLRRIGGGSYGDVWIARTITGVYRAVKVVDKARFADERPFLRELDGITRFQRLVGDQPRQLALMHVGRIEERGMFFYTMELADDVETGTDIDPETYQPLTLKALHERRPVLPAAEAIRIGVELARSLQGLHGAGLIHRDVKPSNIIFVAGVPKLADIGLVSSSDHTLTSLGTPGYSPPEGAGTERADIYSLGKILYQISTGQYTDDFPRLPKNVGTRPDARALLELNEVILKACQPDPNDRYANAQAMLDELLLLQAGRSIKELNAVRERLRTLGRAALWMGAAAAFAILVLGVKNYFAVKALAAQEQAARIRAEQDEQFARYATDLHLAQFSLAGGDLGTARAALRRHLPVGSDPDRRGPEWSALWNDAAGDDERQWGAIGAASVRAVLPAPGGAEFVALEVGAGQEAVAWHLQTGARRVLGTGVRDLGGFTADGRRLIVGGVDGILRTIDLATGGLTEVAGVPGRIQARSVDGRSILMGELVDGGLLLRLWDLESRRELFQWPAAREVPGAGVTAVAIDPGQTAVALAVRWPAESGRPNEIRVLDIPSGATRFATSALGRAQRLVFSPDGRRLATAAIAQPVRIVDAASGDLLAEGATHGGELGALAFSPAGDRVAGACDDGVLRVWSAVSGAEERRMRGHEASPFAVAWLADDTLLSGGDDGTARRWSLTASGRANRAAGFWADALGDIEFVPESGDFVATRRSGSIARIDGATLAPAGKELAAFHPLGFSGGRLHAFGVDLGLLRADVATGTVEPVAPRLEVAARALRIGAAASAKAAAIGYSDGTVVLWDLAAGTARRLEAFHATAVWAVAFSADGRSLATADKAGALALWDAASGARVWSDASERVAATALAFAPAGSSLALGREDGRLQIVDTARRVVVDERRAHSRAFFAAAFHPAGDRLVTAGTDGLLMVWTVPDFRRCAVLQRTSVADGRGEVDSYSSLRFAPDGSMIVGLTETGEITRWTLR